MSRKGKGGGETAKGAVILISSEPFLLLERESELKDQLVSPGERDLNCLALYGWEAGAGQVLEYLQTLPFLGKHRLLIIREIQTFGEWKRLLPYLEDPNPTSVLLMTSSELKRSSTQIKTLSSMAEISEMRRPHGKALISWVTDRFTKAGKSIEPHLSEVLIQIAGEDLSILSSEIEKVVLSSGSRDRIEQEDLAVSAPGGVEIVFNFLDALGERNSAKALFSLKNLLVNDSPPEYLVHMMAWHYRQLLKGMELVQSGLSPSEAAFKMGKRYAGIKEKFARQLGRTSEDFLLKALTALSDCDRELKRGQIPPGTLLDRLVLDLLA